jgi:cytidyltransferase-like protein
MQSDEIIRELPKGLIKWYQFHKGGRALYVACDAAANEPLEEALREEGLQVDVADIHVLDALFDETALGTVAAELGSDYDYIVASGALERSRHPEEMLRFLHGRLERHGKLLLGTDNRLGIRYFCGDRDSFTERNFDGIENYARVNVADRGQLAGRSYAKAELTQMLENAGYAKHRFYSVLPLVDRPQVLLAEDYVPQEELEVRITPQYHSPDTVFLEEERLYTTLLENGLFHAMANGYLIECSPDGTFANAKQVTISMDRGQEDSMATIIRRDDKVEKRAVYEAGRKKLAALMENTQYLQKHGVSMVDAWLEGDAYVMPFVQGEPLTNYFRRILCQDTELFLQELDRLWQLILHSSESVSYEEINWEQFVPYWRERKPDDPNKDKWKKVAFGTQEEQDNLGVILKRGYIDLVSLNGFYIDGEFVFYDQELYLENLPAKVIMKRTIDFIYSGSSEFETILPRQQLEERYRMGAYRQLWAQFSHHFLTELRSEKALFSYHKLCRRDAGVLNSNRQKLNYSTDEYERIFRDIFHGTEGRDIYLFGSGNFTRHFLSQFGSDYHIAGILDNNQGKWGTEMDGIPILSPEHLCSLPAGSYKVLVCIKNYVPVIRQLKTWGVRDYGIYDSNMTYQRKMPVTNLQRGEEHTAPKKYHVGYIAGVFDLFHVGHLNMFKRAKEQCDYLIVGVVNDETVMNGKRTMPYIPFEERLEIVRSCKYVDEAVEIPTEYNDTDEAYRRYQFDVQFSGSDYADDPQWLAKQAFLRKHGSDMVFFPYTQSTSSTKLKAMIEKKLL